MVPRWTPTEGRNKKTALENQKVQQQVLATGASFDNMKEILRPYPKAILWQWAVNLSRQSNGLIQIPSRTERRMKHALVCWYCKWAPGFPLGFPPGNSHAPPDPPHENLTTCPFDDLPPVEDADEKGDSVQERWL
jgi:hypothetical protein